MLQPSQDETAKANPVEPVCLQSLYSATMRSQVTRQTSKTSARRMSSLSQPPTPRRNSAIIDMSKGFIRSALKVTTSNVLKPYHGGYRGRFATPAQKYLRWNLLFTFLILLFLSAAIWVPCVPVVQDASMEIVIAVNGVLHLLWFIGLVNNIRYLCKLRSFAKRVVDLRRQRIVDQNLRLKHLVGIAFYKEPIELMIDTLDSLANQPNARDKISVFAGMEQGTPDKDEKAKKLISMYGNRFERFMVTIHPKGLPGEIPGKCSNFNYGSRVSVAQLRADKEYGLGKNTELLVTTGDCDTIFGERYFDALEEDYLKLEPKQRHRTVWQSPLFYCINLDQSPFFVRAVGLIRAFFMMGYLIPWNINTMSVFSLSLKLFEDGEYVHPGYQVKMDDIIALIRWTCSVGQRCDIRAIPVATLSGPTSGKNYWDELYEWARQIRRWTIGAGEVFHYFVIKSRQLPASVAIVWALRYIFYYGFQLCIASLYGITAPILTLVMLSAMGRPIRGVLVPSESAFNWILLGMLGLQYFWFLGVFVINKMAEKVFPDNRKDNTGILRNVFHWIMTWPTLTAYCCVELAAFLELTVRGKDVCSHSASKKDGLVKPNGAAGAVHPVPDAPPNLAEVV